MTQPDFKPADTRAARIVPLWPCLDCGASLFAAATHADGPIEDDTHPYREAVWECQVCGRRESPLS